ncbi:hypothetical protein Asp14428_40950 [Actinoplanes sp. NBRC 14428]|nr:hypothetical protein Asp14428_40950 [Actinoplanes sp. NBRC 14428]
MDGAEFLEHVGAAVDGGDPVGGLFPYPDAAGFEDGTAARHHPASLTSARASTPSLSSASQLTTSAGAPP